MPILDFGTTAYELYGDAVAGVTNVTSSIAPYCSDGFRTGPPSGGAYLEWSSDETEVWLSWHYYSNEASNIDGTFMEFYDENDVPIIRLWKELGNTTGLYFQYWDGTQWVDISTDFGETTNAERRLDFGVVMNGTTGAVYMYKDRALHASQENFDTTNSGSRSFCKKIGIGFNTTANYVYYSGLIAANEVSVNLEYIQTKPGGAGTYSEWDGDYTDVDETGIDYDDFLEAETDGVRSTFTQTALPGNIDEAGWDVKAFGASAQAYNGSVQALPNFQVMVRSATTDVEGTVRSLAVSKQGFKELHNTDPATGTLWTVTDVAAVESGVKLSS